MNIRSPMPYAAACFFASSGHTMISPLRSPRAYERTLGVYDAPRMRAFNARAFAGVTKTSERSHPGSATSAIAVYGKRGTDARRVRFLTKTRAIRLALAPFAACVSASGRIDLAEFYEFVVFLAPHFRNKRALMADVLRLHAFPVTAIAHFTHEPEPLRATGKTADERRGTLVLPAFHFNSYSGSHVEGTLPHCIHDCLLKSARTPRLLCSGDEWPK